MRNGYGMVGMKLDGTIKKKSNREKIIKGKPFSY